MSQPPNDPHPYTMRLRRLGIDTYQEPVIYMRSDCDVCRSEGFQSQSRIRVQHGDRSIIATLNAVTTNIIGLDEASLSEPAWKALAATEGSFITLTHPAALESLSHVRAKIYGEKLAPGALRSIIQDVAVGNYSDIHLAAFITAVAGARLDFDEIVSLTHAMTDVGDVINWGRRPIVDKHCVGGLPGNRTTLLVVPIVAAFGLLMPKTSSRAITSPAGTADTMETLAPVTHDVPAIRRIVERESGCIVWGGAVRLSPADDILIRVERPLELDSEGQLVASVLSKKAAAGSSHVVVDIPVGPTAKVRSRAAAEHLSDLLIEVGRIVGLKVRIVITDGLQPVGRGIGPALEARDVLAVLQGTPDAPQDLQQRAVTLAANVLELAGAVGNGEGILAAQAILSDGRAWRKFQAICEAQGGMREPPIASYTAVIAAENAGHVKQIDNRRLARVAKLAGAPMDAAAGLMLHVKLGDPIDKGQPLYTIHAESPGELAYARDFVSAHRDIIKVMETQ